MAGLRQVSGADGRWADSGVRDLDPFHSSHPKEHEQWITEVGGTIEARASVSTSTTCRGRERVRV